MAVTPTVESTELLGRTRSGSPLVRAWAERLCGSELGKLRERLRSLPTAKNEFGFDPFGFNPDETLLPLLLVQWLYRHYFRAEVYGLEHIPPGRAILVSNHGGQLPFDGMCIAAALLLDRQPPRLLRAMVEKFIPTLPFFSYLFPRWGQIVGTPENCRRLLDAEEAILVFPEGAKGIAKPFTRRYQLEPFGLGFLRLALETRSPIVPVAVIGAEEQAPSVNLTRVASFLGAPAFPLMLAPPFTPLLPYPTKYRIYFHGPLTFDADPDEDDAELQPLVKQVRNRIQSMVQSGLKERRHIFW
jgi:1-acyl-sn-glycerol-3-phosphate acyltransferase